MRNDLIPLFNEARTAHAGLLIQKGLEKWEDGEKPIKNALINKIASVSPNDLYHLAFNRWLNLSFDSDEFSHLSAAVNGRLFTGLALGGALETGAMVHHCYGMPMIAGSSIKGAVRSYAENLFAKKKDGKIDYRIETKKDKSGKEQKIKHLQFDEAEQQILNVLFGTEGDDDDTGDAGYLIWHDAWWIPNVKNQNKPFASEIVTVHHQKYYQGELNEALDIENPVPNQQIAITGSFYFTIQGDKAWAEYALELLKGALGQQGLGAKGSNGYGYFGGFDELRNDLNKRYQEMQPVDENDPLAIIKKEVSLLTDEQLIESLSREINKFFVKLGLDKANSEDCRNVVKVILEDKSSFVETLSNNDGKNAKKAYKFINQYK